MEFILYIGSTKVSMPKDIHSKYACTKLSRTKTRYKLDKELIKPRSHSQEWKERELSKIYQDPNQHMIEETNIERIPKKKEWTNPLHFSW